MNFTVQHSFDNPNNLINPVPLANMFWDTSLIPAAAINGVAPTSFAVPTAPLWMRVLMNSGTGALRLTIAQYNVVDEVMRAITATVDAYNQVAMVNLDTWSGAAMGVQVVSSLGAAYSLDLSFDDPNDLTNPIPLANMAWERHDDPWPGHRARQHKPSACPPRRSGSGFGRATASATRA